MEGQTGIVKEMSSPQSTPEIQQEPQAKAEKSTADAVDPKPTTRTQEKPVESEASQKQDIDNTDNDKDPTKEQPEEKTKQKEKSKPTEEELTAEEIEQGLDKMWEGLDSDPQKKKAFEKYLAELLSENDVDKNKGEKLIETSAELLRLLKLVFALIIMYVTNPKDGYTGEDFSLSETPPEGDEGYDLPGTDRGRGDPASHESWRNVREGVRKISEPLPFNQFMDLVLKINADNPVKKFKVKKEETRNEKILKNLMKNKLIKQITRKITTTGAKATTLTSRR